MGEALKYIKSQLGKEESDDSPVQEQLLCVSRLRYSALAMGVDNVVKELLPFLEELGAETAQVCSAAPVAAPTASGGGLTWRVARPHRRNLRAGSPTRS